jgi:hypothetical protein
MDLFSINIKKIWRPDPKRTMPGELEFPEDMLYEQEELDEFPDDGKLHQNGEGRIIF